MGSLTKVRRRAIKDFVYAIVSAIRDTDDMLQGLRMIDLVRGRELDVDGKAVRFGLAMEVDGHTTLISPSTEEVMHQAMEAIVKECHWDV